MEKQAKNTICLWYDGGAEDAARFYAKTFPDSSVGAVYLAPGDFPSGKKGDVLTVDFTLMGIPPRGIARRLVVFLLGPRRESFQAVHRRVYLDLQPLWGVDR